MIKVQSARQNLKVGDRIGVITVRDKLQHHGRHLVNVTELTVVRGLRLIC